MIFFNIVKSIEEKSLIQIDYFVNDDCSGKISDSYFQQIASSKCIKSKYDDVECTATTEEKQDIGNYKCIDKLPEKPKIENNKYFTKKADNYKNDTTCNPESMHFSDNPITLKNG